MTRTRSATVRGVLVLLALTLLAAACGGGEETAGELPGAPSAADEPTPAGEAEDDPTAPDPTATATAPDGDAEGELTTVRVATIPISDLGAFADHGLNVEHDRGHQRPERPWEADSSTEVDLVYTNNVSPPVIAAMPVRRDDERRHVQQPRGLLWEGDLDVLEGVEGRIQGTLIPEPFKTQLLGEGANSLGFAYRAGEGNDNETTAIASFVATPQFAQENPETVQRFCEALGVAIAEIEQPDNRDAFLDAMAANTALERDQIEQITLATYTTDVPVDELEELGGYMVQEGLLEELPDLEPILSLP